MTRVRWVTGLILVLAFSGALLGLLPPLAAWYATVLITLIHVALAAILVAVAGPLLWRHIRRNSKLRGATASSWLSLLSLIAMVISGTALLIEGQRGRLALVHTVIGFSLLAILFAHSGITHLKRLAHGSVRLWLSVVFISLVVGAMISARPTHSIVAPDVKEFPPASMRIVGELPPYDEPTMSANRCAQCHAQIVSEWKQSMHAVADTEILYARVVGEFRKEHGFEASNWCAGCHSPLRLGRGELNEKVATVAQPNVDCIVCHTIQKTHEPFGNNDYEMKIASPSGYGLAKPKRLADQLLLVQPAAHKALWNGDFMRSPEFCASCHRQALPDFLADGKGGLVFQDTYREWSQSKYNSADKTVRRTCQDCHMSVQPGLAKDLGNNRPSHLFIGGSIDIARINGAHASYAEGKRFLETAATLTVTPLDRGQKDVGLSVQVTNSGTGHNLPTGVTDLRDVWLEVTVTDDSGSVVYESGKLDPEGFLDPSAVRFGMTLGDGNGGPVHFHHLAKAREILSDTSIPAGETRDARYNVPVLNSRRLHAEVKLLYRSVPQAFINHYMTPDLRSEVVTMSKASATFNVAPN